MTQGILISRRTKLSLRKEYQECKNYFTKRRYSEYRDLYKSVVKLAKVKHHYKSFFQAQGDSRKLWELTNSVLGRHKEKEDLPVELNNATGDKNIVEEFKNLTPSLPTLAINFLRKFLT